MAIKEITLKGPGQVRVRVIKQDSTEAARVFNRSVPTNFSTPFGLRFRVKQVTTSGKSSYWAYSRQIAIPFVLSGTARFRMRSVAASGAMSEWRYASIQTGSAPGEPGSRPLDVFAQGIFDLLIDAFVDRVHLEVRHHDQTAGNVSDRAPSLRVMQNWAESLGLDTMDALLEATRLKMAETFQENLQDFLHVYAQAIQTLRVRRDAYAGKAEDEMARALLYRTVLDAAGDFRLSDQVWADLTLHQALSEKARPLFVGDIASAWTEYLTKDRLAVRAIDALGLIASYALREELPLAAYELLALVETLKRVFKEAVNTGLSIRYLWEVRPLLVDRLLWHALDMGPRWQLRFSLENFLVRPSDQVWVATSDPRAYLQEMLGRKFDDLLSLESEILLKEQARFHPQDKAWNSYLWAFREVFEGMAAWRVYLHQRVVEEKKRFQEGIPMGMGIALGTRMHPHLRENAAVLFGPDEIPHMALERTELFDWSAFHLDDSHILVAFGDDYGASDTEFIMGRFIMGVTPMGSLTYS